MLAGGYNAVTVHGCLTSTDAVSSRSTSCKTRWPLTQTGISDKWWTKYSLLWSVWMQQDVSRSHQQPAIQTCWWRCDKDKCLFFSCDLWESVVIIVASGSPQEFLITFPKCQIRCVVSVYLCQRALNSLKYWRISSTTWVQSQQWPRNMFLIKLNTFFVCMTQ